jgi:hypothetical protein
MAAAFLVGAVAAAALSFQGDGTVAEIAGWLATTWAALSLVIGPQWIRNDLRSDLLKLDLLRSYPLPGRSVVAAETAASTVVLTCMQLGLLLIAYIAFIGVPGLDPPLDLRTAVLAAAVVCLPGINFLGMLIHNGTALLFPAWVHLGSNRPGGVEALGQNMLMIVAYAALLALALALPAAIAAGLGILLEGSLGWWAAVPAALVLLVGIAAESAVLVRRLGRVFERMEPIAGIMT